MTNIQTNKADDKYKRFPRRPWLEQEAINGDNNKTQGCSHIMYPTVTSARSCSKIGHLF